MSAQNDKIYSKVVWALQWKRKIKVVYLQKEIGGKIGYCLLASTDLDLSAQQILK